MEPAVGVGGGDMDVAWGDDDEGTAGRVGEGVDFLALANAEGGAAEEEEGDVGSETGSDIEQAGEFEFLARELEIAEQRRGGIAGAAAQAAASGNFLLQEDFDAGANAGFAAQRFDGAVDEIFFEIFPGQGFVAENLQGDARAARGPEFERVVEGDGLKDGAEFVIAIGAFTEDFQTQVDLGVRRNTDGSRHVRLRLGVGSGGLLRDPMLVLADFLLHFGDFIFFEVGWQGAAPFD